jgi:hypothetical protein
LNSTSNTQHPTPNTQHPTLNAQRRCQRKSVKMGRATASPPRRRHVVKGKRCQRAAGFALSAFSCREGSSSSSSSYSISEDEDEDENERQPGCSFPVTPSFLRGEAARLAFSFSAFLFSGDAAALPRFALTPLAFLKSHSDPALGAKLSDAFDHNPNRNRNPFSIRRLRSRLGLGLRLRLRWQ